MGAASAAYSSSAQPGHHAIGNFTTLSETAFRFTWFYSVAAGIAFALVDWGRAGGFFSRQDGSQKGNPAGTQGGIGMQATLRNFGSTAHQHQHRRRGSRVPRWIVSSQRMLLSAAAVLLLQPHKCRAARASVRTQPEAVVSSTMGRATILNPAATSLLPAKFEVASKFRQTRLDWCEKGKP